MVTLVDPGTTCHLFRSMRWTPAEQVDETAARGVAGLFIGALLGAIAWLAIYRLLRWLLEF